MGPELGAVLAACALGVTHAVEPDHVAGITALTSDADDPRLSALVGGCFAIGHALLVVVWILAAKAVFDVAAFPAGAERVGTLAAGGVLVGLSLYLGVSGARRLVHRHDHGDGQRHAHHHLHLPSFLRLGGGHAHGHGDAAHSHDHAESTGHDHGHGAVAYLKVGTVGALFTLSPPVSMLAFLSATASGTGRTASVGVVAAYAVAITLTMAAVGGGVGVVFRLTGAGGKRLHAAAEVTASLLVFALGVHLLGPAVPGVVG